jgi:hypothetical protein
MARSVADRTNDPDVRELALALFQLALAMETEGAVNPGRSKLNREAPCQSSSKELE